MKKIIGFALSLAVVLTLSVCAFATNTIEGTYRVDVDNEEELAVVIQLDSNGVVSKMLTVQKDNYGYIYLDENEVIIENAVLTRIGSGNLIAEKFSYTPYEVTEYVVNNAVDFASYDPFEYDTYDDYLELNGLYTSTDSSDFD